MKQAEDRLSHDFSAIEFFKYDHLPPRLQKISKPFHDLAMSLIVGEYTRGREITKALDKLLEAKDCAVRGYL